MQLLFQTPAKIVAGKGVFAQLGTLAAPFGKKCLIVTGMSAMQKQGFLDKAVASLAAEGVSSDIFSGVEHDPSLETVDMIRSAIRDADADFVIGLGGGSAIDAAKAAAGLYRTEEPVVLFFDGKEVPAGGLPMVAVPSTFGTGTEVTKVSVLSDNTREIKKSIRHDDMLPRVALVDPEIGGGAPARLAAACGLDALTQAMESYLSIHANDLTRALSIKAAAMLAKSLPESVADAGNIDAREDCALGSTMAGIALNNARLGLVHGLAHPLGAKYKIAHGEACGILLPHVLDYNREAAGAYYEDLSAACGEDAAGFCFRLLEQFGLPGDLKLFNIPEADFNELTELTMPSGSTNSNPRKVTEADVLQLLKKIC